MSSKLIITKIKYKGKQKVFCGLKSSDGFYQVNFVNDNNDTEEKQIKTNRDPQVGDIYIGRVRDIVKNINAAFIEYAPGQVGYYSIEQNDSPVYLNKKNTDKLCQGDLVIVQVEKAAVKTKALVLTSKISFAGKNIVLNIGKTGIGYSSKITNHDQKEHLKQVLQNEIKKEISEDHFGLIIRTNATLAKDSEILKELYELLDEWHHLKGIALSRTCYTILKQEECEYLKLIRGCYDGEIDEIITDDENIFDCLKEFTNNRKYEQYHDKVKLYQDSLLPLYKLHSIEKLTERISEKNVWLKSGAYLVIEPTEAMVVIDVNTGKCIKGKDFQSTVLKVNIEAAKEIAEQIRLRNLSGIIMIDFINMEAEENREMLIHELKKLLVNDRVKTTFVEMTKLNLVELTRKKINPPIYEQLNY